MKISPDQPSGLTALDRPNSYIGRSVPRPNLARLTQGRGQYVTDVVLPRMAHVAFVRSPHAHARIKSIEAAAAKKAPGVIAVVTGAELAQGDHALGRRAHPSQRHQIGAAARDCGRSRVLAGRGGVRGCGAQPRRGGRRLRAGRRGLRTAAQRDRCGNGARSQDAGHPSRAWRQSHFRARAQCRRAGQGLCRGRRRGRDDIRVRPPYRRHQRAARHRRRLESGRSSG